MDTTDKLNRIKAKCQEIITLGEKRTQGKWLDRQDGREALGNVTNRIQSYAGELVSYGHLSTHDAAFIAACAGPAEAMARSTIAAIEFTEKLRRMFSDRMNDLLMALIREVEEEIISAWEGIL